MPKNTLNKVALGISIVIVLLAIVILLNLVKPFKIYIPLKTYVAAAYGLTIILAYIFYPIKKRKDIPRTKVPWYDYIFILFGIIPAGYLVFFPDIWGHNAFMGQASILEIVLCLMLVVSILEAARRIIGWIMLVFIIVISVPVVVTAPYGLSRLSASWYYGSSGLVSGVVTVSYTYILAFLIFGAFLSSSPAGKYIIDGILAIFGRLSGGPAKGAVVASAGVGMITGNGPAGIAITGPLTIPLMKKSGYSPEFAAAVESVAANGGAIMPPVMGIAGFLIASMMGVTYWAVCTAAWIPAILYYIGLYMQVHFEAKKLGLKGLSKEEKIVPLLESLKGGWIYLLPIVLLVYLLAFAHYPPQIAGLYSAFAVMAITLIDWQIHKQTRKNLKGILTWMANSIDDASRQTVIIAIACSSVGIMIAAISASGIGFKISLILTGIAGGNLFLLLFLAFVVSFILGMGLPGIVAFLVLSSLVAPALVDLGVPLMAAYFFLFIAGLAAFITPPDAMNVFVASGIAKSNMMKTAWVAMRLGIMTFILPFIVVYQTALLMIGSPGSILLALVKSIAAVVFLAAGLERFFLKKLSWIEAGLFVIGGVLIFMPGSIYNIAGFAVCVLVFLWHLWSTKRSKRSLALNKN